MSKNPYPTHFKDFKDSQLASDKNAHGSQGGVENLPNQQYDAEDRADTDMDGARTWTGTDRSVFE
jgi:hypothetical protein